MSAERLDRLERVIDTAGVAGRIEALLPIGVRPRQLSVRTLLLGMLLVAADHRPAHLKRVHQALIGLPDQDKWRLRILASWKTGEHLLTYRQTERTFALLARALAKDKPDGTPSQLLSEILDQLLQASVQISGEPQSTSLAVDWTDLETWARPPRKDGQCADPEASWGHRRGTSPGERDKTFFGYYLQAATITKEEHGPEVPELVHRIHLASCDHDPPPAFVPVLQRMHNNGIPISDVLADCGYSYRQPQTWALPLRRLGAQLVQDLHPNDRGMQGTHQGANCANGNLYCPATPKALLELGPLARGATNQQTINHDQKTAELAKYKLSPITSHDQDGYHRVACPAAHSKVRCPLKPQSMTLPHDRPTILAPPKHPPVCCTQQTITVPPTVNAKTAQKHDYPSAAHRRSYNRRTSAERTFASVKDPASSDLSRGSCRLTSLAPIALFTAAVLVTRNLRIAEAFDARQAQQQRRANSRPTTKRRRRHTLEHLLAATNSPP